MGLLRLVIRRLRRSPGFTTVAVLTLALGIGANAAIFAVINGVLLKPLPYPEPGSLVHVSHRAPSVAGLNGDLNCSPTMYFTYREHGKTLQSFGLWSNGSASVTGLAEPEQVQVLYFTHGVLDAIGIPPEQGHWFSEEDTQPGAPETVILTHGYWQTRLGGKAGIIGSKLIINSLPRTVIAVMPETFRFLNIYDNQIILPQRFDRSKVFLGNFSFQGLGRLKPGTSLEQSQADLARLLPAWLEEWPTPPGFSRQLFKDAHIQPALRPLKQQVIGDIHQALWVLMGTVGMVLLIACTNVANLLLVRAEGRQHEIAIQAALGAGRGVIARDMLLESLILGLMGGLVGAGLAWAGLRALVASGPSTIPRLSEIQMDGTVLGFTLVVSLIAALLFAAVPILKYATPQIALALRAGGRSMSHSRERHRARNVLVVAQVALAMVLLTACGLMIRTFEAMRHVDPGFQRPEETQLLRVSFPDSVIKEPVRVIRIEDEIRQRLATIPGVSAVSFAGSVPLDTNNSSDVLSFEDKLVPAGSVPTVRRYRYVSPGYFQTMGTPLIAGRDLTWTDLFDARKVGLVSRNLAIEVFGSPQAAIGRRMREGSADPWREIVGVVGDVHSDGMHQPVPATVYWPTYMKNFYDPEFVSRSVTFVVRTSRAGTEKLLDEARKAVWSVQPSVPVYGVRTMKDLYDRSMARTSFTLVMLGIAGSMAFLLGVIGIYGVISYAVTQRTREMGIRRALGAEDGTLHAMFVKQAFALCVVGLAIGLGAAAGLAQYMKTLLYGVTPLDPATYTAVPVGLALATIVASYLPARRASRVDPMDALRAD